MEPQRWQEIDGIFAAALEHDSAAVLEALLKLSTERYVPPYHIALIYNGLQEGYGFYLRFQTQECGLG